MARRPMPSAASCARRSDLPVDPTRPTFGPYVVLNVDVVGHGPMVASKPLLRARRLLRVARDDQLGPWACPLLGGRVPGHDVRGDALRVDAFRLDQLEHVG